MSPRLVNTGVGNHDTVRWSCSCCAIHCGEVWEKAARGIKHSHFRHSQPPFLVTGGAAEMKDSACKDRRVGPVYVARCGLKKLAAETPRGYTLDAPPWCMLPVVV